MSKRKAATALDDAWLAEADSVFSAGTPIAEGEAFYSMELGTHKVPMSLHAANRAKLVARMGAAGHGSGVVLLQGGKSSNKYCSDTEAVFEQESYFNYLFGVAEPDWYAAIELPTGRTTLFMARLPAEYAVWMGRIVPPEEFARTYAPDGGVRYADELDSYLKEKLQQQGGGGGGGAAAAGGAEIDPASLAPLYLLRGLNTDSGEYTSTTADFEGLKWYAHVDLAALHPQLAECRVVKSAAELELMRYSSWLTSMAHVEVMKGIKAGMAEYELEAIFKHFIYRNGGARHEAYTCICACGPNSAVLHYGHAGAPNNRVLGEGDIALLDMGARYHGYTSDITCSYPVRGTFDADQRAIYETVLEAQRQIMAAMKPGVSWPDMHRLMWRVTLTHLVALGALAGDVDEMLEAEVGAVFIPCGLGHLIGCDTHDVGGYNPGTPARIGEPGIKALRTARLLEEGMVLTVEPGLYVRSRLVLSRLLLTTHDSRLLVPTHSSTRLSTRYFIDHTIDNALADERQAKFFVRERIAQLRAFGGVRLEDVVAVTATGIANYTLAPRTVEEVESVMAGGAWPPKKDGAKWLQRQWLRPLEEE